MYLNLTEKIMIEKTQSLEGWSKSITDDNKNIRVICIGNIKNCNDEIIKNFNIKTDIINILDKYNNDMICMIPVLHFDTSYSTLALYLVSLYSCMIVVSLKLL